MANRTDKIAENLEKRIDALRQLESKTSSATIPLFIKEQDIRLHGKETKINPKLTDDELQQLLNNIAANGNIEKLKQKVEHTEMIEQAVIQLQRACERLGRVQESLTRWQSTWAITEQLETAVNIALLQIQDASTRTATAEGIAKNLQIIGYSQSVNPDGLLILSPVDLFRDCDADTRLNMAAKETIKTIGDFKAVIDAIRYAMKHWGLWLFMPATKAYIRNLEKTAEVHNYIWGKYEDKRQMNTENEPTQEQIESDKPLLYEVYRLMPKYDDIPLNEETRNIFIKHYLGIDEGRKEK